MPLSTECAAALLSFRYPSIILGIQEREKRPHEKYQLGTRDCGRSEIAWKGGLLFNPLADHLANPGSTSPYKQSLSVQRTIEDY